MIYSVCKCDTLPSVRYLMREEKERFKLWQHEGDNLDERIVTISCKRVHGATQARPCETSGCLRPRCTMKVSNKTRLLCRREQLRSPAKKLSSLSLADAVDADDFGGKSHLSRMDRKTFAVH